MFSERSDWRFDRDCALDTCEASDSRWAGARAVAKTSRGKRQREESASSAPPTNVLFEYIKSQMFRVIHADGAIGGITPSGNLHMAFYSERPAIPRAQVHRREEDGTLGPLVPEQTISRPGVVREMDVDVVLSAAAVDGLIQWLNERKKELEAYQERFRARFGDKN